MSNKTDEPRNKGGRPKIEVTPEQVENLAQFGLNHTERFVNDRTLTDFPMPSALRCFRERGPCA